MIKYFSFFDYAPDFAEIYRFLPVAATTIKVQRSLEKLIKEKRLSEKGKRYTPGEYQYKLKEQRTRYRSSQQKLGKIKPYLNLLKVFPQVKFVGLSGSLAMLNAKKNDDIDLFVITDQNRLWTGRLICLLLATFFGRRTFNDQHSNDKLCLNLFFDSLKMEIRTKKRSFYVAHEVLQLKPLLNKDHTYERFLAANNWVFRLFPNAQAQSINRGLTYNLLGIGKGARSAELPSSHQKLHVFASLLENLLKKLQFYLINRHKTTEIITDTQLWFFPDDFETKIPA